MSVQYALALRIATAGKLNVNSKRKIIGREIPLDRLIVLLVKVLRSLSRAHSSNCFTRMGVVASPRIHAHLASFACRISTWLCLEGLDSHSRPHVSKSMGVVTLTAIGAVLSPQPILANLSFIEILLVLHRRWFLIVLVWQ